MCANLYNNRTDSTGLKSMLNSNHKSVKVHSWPYQILNKDLPGEYIPGEANIVIFFCLGHKNVLKTGKRNYPRAFPERVRL